MDGSAARLLLYEKLFFFPAFGTFVPCLRYRHTMCVSLTAGCYQSLPGAINHLQYYVLTLHKKQTKSTSSGVI